MTERRRANDDYETTVVMPWEPLPDKPRFPVSAETEERPKQPVLYLPDGRALSRHRPFGFRPEDAKP